MSDESGRETLPKLAGTMQGEVQLLPFGCIHNRIPRQRG